MPSADLASNCYVYCSVRTQNETHDNLTKIFILLVILAATGILLGTKRLVFSILKLQKFSFPPCKNNTNFRFKFFVPTSVDASKIN